MTRTDPVAEYLKHRNAAAHLHRLGIAGLVSRWEKTVDEIAAGYRAGLDDYLNDLDLRQLLHELERDLPQAWTAADRARLGALDRRFRALLAPRDDCLWGTAAAKDHEWTAPENWWYFGEPKRPGADLARDLGRAKST
jgi:hypothetical protein